MGLMMTMARSVRPGTQTRSRCTHGLPSDGGEEVKVNGGGGGVCSITRVTTITAWQRAWLGDLP